MANLKEPPERLEEGSLTVDIDHLLSIVSSRPQVRNTNAEIAEKVSVEACFAWIEFCE